jgi:hypothetical protein
LHPGACLDVVVQYHAVQRAGKPCELVIESDDPREPVRCVDVIAWTIWDCCDVQECDCHKQKREPCCECHKRCGKRRDEDDEEEGKEDRREE